MVDKIAPTVPETSSRFRHPVVQKHASVATIRLFLNNVAEMALAHVIENKVEAAYRRGDLFAKRRKMMQEWEDYLGELKA